MKFHSMQATYLEDKASQLFCVARMPAMDASVSCYVANPSLSMKTLAVFPCTYNDKSPNQVNSDCYGYISVGQDVHTFFKRPSLTWVCGN